VTKTFNIDIKKSIERGRLTKIYKDSWVTKFDKIAFFILFFALITYPLILIFEVADFSNPNDSAFSYILIIVILFALYGIYRKIIENRLIRIKTSLSDQQIQKEIISYLHDRKIENYKKGKNCIIATDYSSLSINKLHGKTINFLWADNLLLFNITKENPKVNLPVFFSHLFLKADLQKRLKRAEKVISPNK
jgi:hypothetical protein